MRGPVGTGMASHWKGAAVRHFCRVIRRVPHRGTFPGPAKLHRQPRSFRKRSVELTHSFAARGCEALAELPGQPDRQPLEHSVSIAGALFSLLFDFHDFPSNVPVRMDHRCIHRASDPLSGRLDDSGNAFVQLVLFSRKIAHAVLLHGPTGIRRDSLFISPLDICRADAISKCQRGQKSLWSLLGWKSVAASAWCTRGVRHTARLHFQTSGYPDFPYPILHSIQAVSTRLVTTHDLESMVSEQASGSFRISASSCNRNLRG